jgi:hypothetical protein
VKRAYRELVKVWHPDRFAQAPHLQQHALEKIQMINHAYARLRVLRPDPATSPLPTPLWFWRLRQLRRLRRIPPWLIALVAFVVLRLSFDYLALVPTLLLPQQERLVVEKEDRVESAGGIEAKAAAMQVSTPDLPASPGWSSGYFTVGSTKAEVLAVQGPPTLTSENVWEYGGSRVYFRYERVSRWEMWPRSPLKVKLLPGSPSEAAPAYFTVGSTKDDVLVVQGTPTRFSDRVWEYGHSRVYFEADRVTRWEEWRGSPLKARYALQGED